MFAQPAESYSNSVRVEGIPSGSGVRPAADGYEGHAGGGPGETGCDPSIMDTPDAPAPPGAPPDDDDSDEDD